MNNFYALPIFLAIITTFISIFLLRPFAIGINLVDIPNNRKTHTGVIPLIGGISMYTGIVVSLLASSNNLNEFNYFLLASFIIVIVGILDDHHDISVLIRLIFQILVALIVVSVGENILISFGNILGNGELILDDWAIFLSVIAVIAAMNAVNMADGLHGLAGGCSLITFIAILVLSFDSFSVDSFLLAILFCSVLPVFLIYNLCIGISVKKRIFMGDSGSMLLGVSIAWLLLDLSQGANKSFLPVTALWIFSMPIIELVSTIIRRLVSGKSLFKPDLLHFHHILIWLGLKEKMALSLILLLSFLLALIGVICEWNNVSEQKMFFMFLFIFVTYSSANIIISKKIENSIKSEFK
jgi:UDP-GlcNAc:undecaprenyl-phosphate/decaprenyl-phosphate GlcNAc-1-phosphate transferase